MADKCCTIAGCGCRRHGRGFCGRHYNNLLKTGSPFGKRLSAEDRFWSKVDKDGPTPPHRPGLGPCWVYTAGLNEDGYGQFWADRKNHHAHGWGYKRFVGPIPDGLQLDHLCRNRACVRFSHLEPVTCRENTLRGETVSAANAAKTHCKNGHEFNVENTYLHPSGSRICRPCFREYDREWKRRRREAIVA